MRTRRIAGFLLIILGVLLWADAGWVGAFHGAWFDHAEWVRFGFLLWLGTVLALAGCWLAYRSRAAAWTAALVVVASFAIVYVHDRYLRYATASEVHSSSP